MGWSLLMFILFLALYTRPNTSHTHPQYTSHDFLPILSSYLLALSLLSFAATLRLWKIPLPLFI
jgi:hypothetical protein